MGLRDYSLYNIIQRNAIWFRDENCLILGDKKLTHGEFKDKVDKIACALKSRGLTKGDRLAILAQNCLEYIYLYGVAAKLGAIAVPINWRLTHEEVHYVISDTTPKFMFVSPDFQALAAPLAAQSDFLADCFIFGPSHNGFTSFDQLLDHDPDQSDLEVGNDDPFIIMHTAATEGRPRGAILSHQNLVSSSLQYMSLFHLDHRDCFLAMLPLFHITCLGFCLSAMVAGGSNVILPRFDAEAALRSIARHRVTFSAEFPPIMETLLSRNRELKCDLTSLRTVLGLSGPAVAQEFESLPGAQYWVGYGQTETSGLVVGSPYFAKQGAAGRPTFLAEVAVVNQKGASAAADEEGEIAVRGPLVFSGYWRQGPGSRSTGMSSWHHTGDLGRIDQDGFLWYCGRKPEKELIKSGGENIYPAEVEGALLDHPSIEQVCVIGVADQKWGEAVKAVCVLCGDAALTENELIDFVSSRIARYKKPRYVEFVKELPRDASDNLDRDAVKRLYGS